MKDDKSISEPYTYCFFELTIYILLNGLIASALFIKGLYAKVSYIIIKQWGIRDELIW